MPVCQLSPDDLRVGQPTPFGLLDANGHLLMARGVVVESDAHRDQLLSRGLFVDEQAHEDYRRAMAGRVHAMLDDNELLGRIADVQPTAPTAEFAAPARHVNDPLAALGELQIHAGKLLREAPQADFTMRLRKVQQALWALMEADADIALLVLIDATTNEIRQYSVTHAMLVTVVCELASRHLPAWQPAWRESLRYAALTMNMAMTDLQDLLAQQASPPDPAQRTLIGSHALRAVHALKLAGVDDPLWVEAVRHHHVAPPGALEGMAPPMQLARLIQRADIFAARLSPRRKRAALSGTAAAQAAYLDERKQPDEAGSAIIKGVGIYPPGSFVRLASGEVAVVMRRGARANEPVVASVLSRAGTLLGQPVLRDTHQTKFAVTAGVAPQDVRLRLNMERLLRLL
jgi:hypothetical protein